jgi:hypothetical protein
MKSQIFIWKRSTSLSHSGNIKVEMSKEYTHSNSYIFIATNKKSSVTVPRGQARAAPDSCGLGSSQLCNRDCRVAQAGDQQQGDREGQALQHLCAPALHNPCAMTNLHSW